MSNFFGTSAVIFSLACLTFGLATQIYKNWKHQNCKGLSFWFCILAFGSYSSWVGYGVSKPDYFLCIPQIPGTILMSVILFQFWLYRKPGESNIMDKP